MAVKKAIITSKKAAPSQSGASKTVKKTVSKTSTANKAVSAVTKPGIKTQTVSKSPSSTAQSAVSGIFGGKVTQTQGYGNKNTLYKSGVHDGEDYAGAMNTKIYAPPGTWQAEKVVGNVTRPGFKNNYQDNQGWGNQVVLRNKDTGERVSFAHLANTGVQQGQDVSGGAFLGGMGNTGNVVGKTGIHTDIRYYDPQGKSLAFSQSPYGKYLNESFSVNQTLAQTPQMPQFQNNIQSPRLSQTAFLPSMPQQQAPDPYLPRQGAMSQGLAMIPQTNAYAEPMKEEKTQEKRFWWQV